MIEDPRLLTVREVAAQFRVNPRTVNAWVRAGRIRVIRLPGGGHFRIPASEVDRIFATDGRSAS